MQPRLASQRPLSPALSCAGTILHWPARRPILSVKITEHAGSWPAGRAQKPKVGGTLRLDCPSPSQQWQSLGSGTVTVSHGRTDVSVHFFFPLLAVLLPTNNCRCQAS